MPQYIFNGKPIISATVSMPRVGVWNGHILSDAYEDFSGPVTLTTEDNKFALTGTAHREGTFVGHQGAYFIGGAGGLDQKVSPKSYEGYTVRSVLSEILKACGEQLSSKADASLLNAYLPTWVRLGHTGKAAVQALLAYKGAEAWRINPDGTFYACNHEVWPKVSTTDFQLLEWNRAEGWAKIASDQPFALPGQIITLTEATGKLDQKISYLVHRFDAQSTTSQLFLEDP